MKRKILHMKRKLGRKANNLLRQSRGEPTVEEARKLRIKAEKAFHVIKKNIASCKNKEHIEILIEMILMFERKYAAVDKRFALLKEELSFRQEQLGFI